MSNSRSEDFILIVWVWETMIKILSKISIFDLIMTQIISRLDWKPKSKYLFVDIWVLGHTVLSIVAMIISRFSDNKILLNVILYYGLLRVFEIFIYQIKVNLIDSYKENANVRSYRRVVLALIHNFVEIIFWFTASYLFLITWFDIPNQSTSLIQALYISFVTMTTFGPPNFNINSSPAMIIIMIQSIVGLLMTLVSLARFISLLPRPKSFDSMEK